MGSLLLVGITVLMMGGLALTVLGMDGPARSPQLLLVPSAHPGTDQDWGTADDHVRVLHKGGEALPRDETTIVLHINGTTTRYEGALLDGGFSDGSLTLGEQWTRTGPLPLGARIALDVVHAGQASAVVASSVLHVPRTHADPCARDTIPPAVAAWTQSPADVTAITTGDVNVRIEVVDNCSGVNATVAPRLHSRIVGPSSPFTDHGPMGFVSGTTWEADIPDPTWSAQAGKTLEYHVSGLTDHQGNSGASSVQKDIIQLAGTQTYVTGFDPDTGTMGNFARMQSGTDSGAFATIRETETGPGPATQTLDAAAATVENGWTDTQHAAASDDQYTTKSGNAPGFVEYSITDPAAIGTISQVVLKAEVATSKTSADWYLQACNAGTCSAQSGGLGAPTSDTNISYDVSAPALRPGGIGTWQWSDIQDLRVRVHGDGTGNPTFSIDHVWVEVTADGSTYRMQMDLEIDGVPLGAQHAVEMRHETFGDRFSLQAWDGAAWNTRATLESPGTMSGLVHVLTPQEYNGGSVRLRVIDVAASGTQGEVRVDYLRVVTS